MRDVVASVNFRETRPFSTSIALAGSETGRMGRWEAFLYWGTRPFFRCQGKILPATVRRHRCVPLSAPPGSLSPGGCCLAPSEWCYAAWSLPDPPRRPSPS